MAKSINRRKLLMFGGSLVTLGSLGFVPDLEASRKRQRRHRRLQLDVSCNANSIRFTGPQGPNPNDSADAGPHPYYGASFVVLGTIYHGGLFSLNGNSVGLNPDGTPEFPDEVLGTWICSGWFVGDSDGDGSITPNDDAAKGGIFTPGGRFVVTTQIYDLDPDHPGNKTLISNGGELIDLNVPYKRAITGGTGPFRSARGEVTQTAVGANRTGLFNFNFDFALQTLIIPQGIPDNFPFL